MNERIRELAKEAGYSKDFLAIGFPKNMEKFAELIVKECASEYNKLVNGDAVVLPKDREHAEALVRVGMFYLENNK